MASASANVTASGSRDEPNVLEKKDLKLEQNNAINYCVRQKMTATDAFKEITKAYGDNALKRTQVFALASCKLQKHPQ